MRLFFSFLMLGLLLMIFQSALAQWVSPPWCPDLGLLLVVALALRWPVLTTGLFLVAMLGFAADILSGSLLGQQALLRILAFTGAFVAGQKFNLKGTWPLVIFVFSVTFIYGVTIYLSSLFFGAAVAGQVWGWLIDNFWHACINALFAPAVLSLCSRVFSWVNGQLGTERSLHMQADGGSM